MSSNKFVEVSCEVIPEWLDYDHCTIVANTEEEWDNVETEGEE